MFNSVSNVVQERFLKLLHKELKKTDSPELSFENFGDFSDFCFRRGLPVFKFIAFKLTNPHESFLDLFSGRYEYNEIYRALTEAYRKESDFPGALVFSGVRNELFVGFGYDSRLIGRKGVVYIDIGGEYLVMRLRDFLRCVLNNQE